MTREVVIDVIALCLLALVSTGLPLLVGLVVNIVRRFERYRRY